MNKKHHTKAEAKKLLTKYLEFNGLRKTPERFKILDEIYSDDGNFDIEALYISMKSKHYRIARASLYNTIKLLLDCRLIDENKFGKNIKQFSKALK